jgi:hypothetical protein
MNQLLAAAREVQEFLEARTWRFCFIGGLAVLRWGEPRTTQDVDLTLLTGFGHEEDFVDPLLATFSARIPEARSFALTRRVLLLKASNGVGADISLGGLAFEDSVVSRSSLFDFGDDVFLRTCSAEDLIVLKSFAARPQDWRDVQGILVRQGPALDLKYIRKELRPLVDVKEQPEILARFESALREEGLS